MRLDNFLVLSFFQRTKIDEIEKPRSLNRSIVEKKKGKQFPEFEIFSTARQKTLEVLMFLTQFWQ